VIQHRQFRHVAKLGTLALCIALATGCANVKRMFSSPGTDKTALPAELAKIEATRRLEATWSASVGDQGEKQGRRITIAYSNGRVFTANEEGRVHAFDADTGREIWRRDLEMPVSGGPGAGNEAVVVGSLEGDVVAFAPETGRELWRAKVPSEVLAQPAVTPLTTIVRSIDGTISGIATADGETRWKVLREMPLLSLRGSGPVRVEEGRVFVGLDNGKVAALAEQDGTVGWETNLGNRDGKTEIDRLSDVDGSLATISDSLYASAYNGDLAEIDVTNGNPRWTRKLGSATGVVIAEDNLVLTDSEGTVHVADRRSGANIWQFKEFKNRQLTSPAVLNDTIVVGDLEGYLHLLDLKSGKVVGRERQDDGFAVPPLAAGGSLFVLSLDGKLKAYRVAR
jgi:outer membrane protein assembly factor BamB